MEKEWFATWFDTSYYHVLYKNRNNEEAKVFIANLANYLALPPHAEVLDLACGKGRHSITLNELGYAVHGVDLSANSIAEASKHEKEGLTFGVQDMRLPIPNRSFTAVFNLFTSFGYFDDTSDKLKVLQSVRQMLDDKGLLIIDFMNATRVINTLVTEESKTVDGIDFSIQRNYDGTHIFKDIHFEDNGRDYHFTERVQALRFEDFQSLLSESRFEILRTFGDFNLSPFEAETSDRLILIAQKN